MAETTTKTPKKTTVKVAWKKLSPTAIIPKKAHETDAGFDLFSDEDLVIKESELVSKLSFKIAETLSKLKK